MFALCFQNESNNEFSLQILIATKSTQFIYKTLSGESFFIWLFCFYLLHIILMHYTALVKQRLPMSICH